MTRLRDQRGVSLIELLVAIVVFAILILVMDAVFVNAHRGARKAELSAGVNQNARVAVDRLIAEIQESSTGEIQIGAGGTSLIFRSARPSDASSAFCMDWMTNTEPLAAATQGLCSGVPLTGTYAPVWQRWIAYYFDAGSNQLRRVASSSVLTLPVSGGQVIATSVESFTVDLSGGAFSVAIKGTGQEVAQGSDIPPQEIRLNVSTEIRN